MTLRNTYIRNIMKSNIEGGRQGRGVRRGWDSRRGKEGKGRAGSGGMKGDGKRINERGKREIRRQGEAGL